MQTYIYMQLGRQIDTLDILFDILDRLGRYIRLYKLDRLDQIRQIDRQICNKLVSDFIYVDI